MRGRDLTQVRREILARFSAYGIFIASLGAVLGAAMALAADLHPSSFPATAIDLVRHTNNIGFRVMTTLTLAGIGAGVCIVLAGAVVALSKRR